MNRHSIGIVGAGGIAETLHLPVLTSMPNVQIAWIADLNAERAQAVAAAYRARAVALPSDPGALPPCDAALLAIPPAARLPYFEAFAARGTAVMAEKPFAITPDEHRRILDLFAPHEVACGYQRRTYRSTVIIEKSISEGWFGAARQISIHEGDRTKHTETRSPHLEEVSLAGGGVLISLGCHALDWALHVTRAKSYEIPHQDVVFDGDLDRKASATIVLEGERGPVELDFCASWLDPQRNRIDLRFENAELSTGIGANAAVEIHDRAGGRPQGELVSQLGGASTLNQSFFLEWSMFLDGLERGEPSMMSASKALMTTSLIDDIYRSARHP